MELDHKAHGFDSKHQGRKRSQTDHTWRPIDECGLADLGLMSQVFVWTNSTVRECYGRSSILPACLWRSKRP